MSGFQTSEQNPTPSGLRNFFFGSRVSGTPDETAGLASDLGDFFQKQVSEGFSGRLGAQGVADQFGIDFGELGLGEVASSLLRASDPSARLAEFDRVNRPAQQRAITSGNAQRAQQFGTAGGRFSRNLLGANAAGTAQLEEGFDRARFDAFNAAGNQQLASLSALLQSIPGMSAASLDPIRLAAQFGAPGAPQFQQGALGEIIAAGGRVAAAAAL